MLCNMVGYVACNITYVDSYLKQIMNMALFLSTLQPQAQLDQDIRYQIVKICHFLSHVQWSCLLFICKFKSFVEVARCKG